jgi:hypothetical protein
VPPYGVLALRLSRFWLLAAAAVTSCECVLQHAVHLSSTHSLLVAARRAMLSCDSFTHVGLMSTPTTRPDLPACRETHNSLG